MILKTRPGKWNGTWKWLEFGNHHPPCLCKFPSGMQVPFLFSLHVQRGFRGETGLLVLSETRKWHLVIAIFSNTPCKGNSDSRHHAVCQICCQDGWRPAFLIVGCASSKKSWATCTKLDIGSLLLIIWMISFNHRYPETKTWMQLKFLRPKQTNSCLNPSLTH